MNSGLLSRLYAGSNPVGRTIFVMHHTKNKGDIGLTYTIANLTGLGYYCCLPISEHLPFDLVITDNNGENLKRVQVKYRSKTDGKITLKLANSYNYNNENYIVPHDLTKLDAYAIYCEETNKVYYINNYELLDRQNVTIRIDFPKNNQIKNCLFSYVYENPERMFIPRDRINRYNQKLLAEYLKVNSFTPNKSVSSYLEKSELVELLKTKTPQEIANELQVTGATVRRWCRNFELEKSDEYNW